MRGVEKEFGKMDSINAVVRGKVLLFQAFSRADGFRNTP